MAVDRQCHGQVRGVPTKLGCVEVPPIDSIVRKDVRRVCRTSNFDFLFFHHFPPPCCFPSFLESSGSANQELRKDSGDSSKQLQTLAFESGVSADDLVSCIQKGTTKTLSLTRGSAAMSSGRDPGGERLTFSVKLG